MTKNQIEYVKHLETKRSNLVQEQLTRDRDSVAKELGFANLAESKRHNIVSEQTAQFNAMEVSRHNREMEGLQQQTIQLNVRELDERARHNLETEALQRMAHEENVRMHKVDESLRQMSLDESKRHNLVLEGETQRHNVVGETLEMGRLDEQIRHNRSSEANTYFANATQRLLYTETARANQARESESKRHNLTQEGVDRARIDLGYAQVGLGYRQLDEQARHNVSTEREIHRSNVAHEQEDIRSNRASEKELKRSHREQERIADRNVRSQVARNREQSRHNREMESIDRDRVKQGWVTSVSGAVRTGSDVARTWLPLFGG